MISYLILEKSIETNYSDNLFIKELVETNRSDNLLTKEPIKLHTRGLTADNLIEKRTNCSLSYQELVKQGISDLLKKQLVGKVLVNLISTQINDALVNLVIGVNFLRKVCPKICVILQVLPLFILWLQYKKLMYLLMCLFIFFHSKIFYIFCCPKMKKKVPWIS